jgi:hypothetical protein
VRECPECSYVLAPDGTTCERCGTATPIAAAPRRPVPVGAPPRSTAEPATQGGAGLGSTERIDFAALSAELGWSPPDTSARIQAKGRSWKRVAIAVFVVVLAVFGLNAWKSMRSAPAKDLSEYVDGEGIDYAPDGLGYSIRLPQAPAARSATQTFEDVDVATHSATVEGDNWELVVGALTLPFSIEDDVTRDVLRDAVESDVRTQPMFAGSTVEQMTESTHAGHPAIEVQLEASDGNPFAMKYVMAGDSIYMFGAHAARGADKVFAAMNESFELTGAAR